MSTDDQEPMVQVVKKTPMHEQDFKASSTGLVHGMSPEPYEVQHTYRQHLATLSLSLHPFHIDDTTV